MSEDRKVCGYEIVVLGLEHEQCFRGFGVAHTDYADCAVGIGVTAEEALDDALTVLADNGWDTDRVDQDCSNRLPEHVASYPDMTDAEIEHGELHVYVGVRVR